MSETVDWSRMGWRSWAEPAEVGARLAAGADPDAVAGGRGKPLHQAAAWGSPESIALLAARVADVDADENGRTALWVAVNEGRFDNARALIAAGADPWRPMMSGWSPARLSLATLDPRHTLPLPPPPEAPPGPAGDPPDRVFAGKTPSGDATTPFFPEKGEEVDQGPGAAATGLTEGEWAAVVEARRLVPILADLDYDGLSLACVAGIDAVEAIRRLDGDPIADQSIVEDLLEDPSYDDDDIPVMSVTDVPGGCVVSQPWGYGASMPVVARLLSAGTVCYSMYANPKSGNQGAITVDGETRGWDLHPGGGWPEADAPADEVLRTHLYRGHALAYCCAFADLRLIDARAVAGPGDLHFRLPDGRDYWSVE